MVPNGCLLCDGSSLLRLDTDLATNIGYTFGNFLFWISSLFVFDRAQMSERITGNGSKKLPNIALPLTQYHGMAWNILILDMDNAHTCFHLAISFRRVDAYGNHVARVQRGEKMRPALERRKDVLRGFINELAIGEVVVVNSESEAGLATSSVDIIQQLALCGSRDGLHTKRPDTLYQCLNLTS